MSRSEPDNRQPNPSTRWFEWAGGSDGGFVRHYDKQAGEKVTVSLPFQFLVLDELSVIKGWHDASNSGITSNEVRNISKDQLTVRSFEGGAIASGYYADIKDKAKSAGAHFQASVYIAYKNDDGLVIGNLGLKGAAFRKWIDFKGDAKNAIYDRAVTITGYEDAKKGATSYRIPIFALKECSVETRAQALTLDKQLQEYLRSYLAGRHEPAIQEVAQTTTTAAPETAQDNGGFEDDDIPF